MRVVVIGGSAGGLATALVLARDGHEVTVVERDVLDPAPDVETAAAHALRPTAPQIVQPHVLLAASRAALAERLPDVLDELLAAGVALADLDSQMPPELAERSPAPGDDALRPLMTRRSTLDWVLARTAVADPRITLRHGVAVTGLRADDGDPPRVHGVRTDAGPVEADLVVDAAGRRSAVDRWLDAIGARRSHLDTAPCGLAYYSRHYRIASDAAPGPPTTRVVMGFDEFNIGLWAGDHATVQLGLVPLAADRRFRPARDPAVFDAVARRVPYYAGWLDALEPITDVAVMGGLHNTLRRLVVDRRPVATGLLAVGDAVATTNPTFGRGIGVTLRTVLDLADVLAAHPDDPWARAVAMDDAITRHVEPWYADQAATDAARLAAMRHVVLGAPAPPPPPPITDRVTFGQLRAAATADPAAFRGVTRVMGMVGAPDDTYRDPALVASVRRSLDAGVPRPAGPTREELERALAS